MRLLQASARPLKVVEYLKDTPSEAELEQIIAKLDQPAKALVRTKEVELVGLQLDLEDARAIAKALHRCPKLLERPVAVHGDRAIIGRPPERVRELFD